MNIKPIPDSNDPIVLRTDFSDDAIWETICREIQTPDPEFGFLAYVNFLSDASFEGLAEIELLANNLAIYEHAFIFIVDKQTVSNAEHPILCLGLKYNEGMKLRTIPSEMWIIENNLSVSNMDFEDLLTALDEEGVFRGFKY